jgi:pantoate--beta-alanine ligase
MVLFKKTDLLISYLQKARSEGKTIGFAPTMGALHAGHISLVAASKKGNDLTVVSIFVNPAQFNNKKDFDKYPVTIEKDMEWLLKADCDVLFWPSVEEIYPAGYDQSPHYDLGYLETILEGKYRPGHFQGVCKVMHRLLSIVQPADLYMGQKDYQQCMVVNRLLTLIPSPARLHTCPILREPDGLAMSSRNTRLTPEEREKATAISRALYYIKENVKPGGLEDMLGAANGILAGNEFKVDYVAIGDAQTLELLNTWDGQQKVVALIAAFQHEVRLIDNMLLN